ncbi:hypothetical protein CLOSTMETH_00430 [[Clostridium] methylpentosum DSM 5476]|uniref:Uncharacterized protein n=1 Tax=[Clostridium] methylpentosum DSM 5476 TaxID=537013 RepID=C0E9D1_9FIRM|nr:hypothetical protein CLOSTMETH_00430 [[Clostridium] methylpentosum DSM 5476]
MGSKAIRVLSSIKNSPESTKTKKRPALFGFAIPQTLYLRFDNL